MRTFIIATATTAAAAPFSLPVLTQQRQGAVGTGTAAIERIQDCSSGGNTCSTTYAQIYCLQMGKPISEM
jgi:hypothetical protein